MSEETAEKIGLMADRMDNLLAAMLMKLPPEMHLEQLKMALEEMSEELKNIHMAETGVNPWE